MVEAVYSTFCFVSQGKGTGQFFWGTKLNQLVEVDRCRKKTISTEKEEWMDPLYHVVCKPQTKQATRNGNQCAKDIKESIFHYSICAYRYSIIKYLEKQRKEVGLLQRVRIKSSMQFSIIILKSKCQKMRFLKLRILDYYQWQIKYRRCICVKAYSYYIGHSSVTNTGLGQRQIEMI